MSCNINSFTISKLLASLTEHLDSTYRGQLYTITSFQVQPGCGEMDNFLSSIYKVALCIKVFLEKADSSKAGRDFVEEKFNFICKSTILGDEGRDNLEKYYWNILFTKEQGVYQLLENLKQELEISEWELCPKMHHCYTEGEDYACIILDDLVSKGFYIPKTLDEGLSLEECKLVMKNLARLHALSLVLEGKQGCRLPAKYEICTTELMFSSGVEPALKPLTYNSFQGFLQLTEKFRPDLLPLLKKIDEDENIWDRLCELVKPGKSSFSCLCHGDPRLNNIFIENSHKLPTNATEDNECSNNGSYFPNKGSNSQKGKEAEVGLRFIDFQLTRYSSPSTDLQYCMHMNTSREFREKHTDTVLETYYAEFRAVLGRFQGVKLEQWEGVEGWTLEKLKEEYHQCSMYGFLVSVILLPMILLRPEVDIDKSMSQMTKAERTQFFHERADLVLSIGSKNDGMRQRLFELCDEMVAKNVIPTQIL